MHLESKLPAEVVFQQGEMGTKFYIILEGQVKVLMQEHSLSRQVGNLKAGSSFGEVALVKDQQRMATVQCISKCYFAVLTKEVFNRLIGVSQQEKLHKKV